MPYTPPTMPDGTPPRPARTLTSPRALHAAGLLPAAAVPAAEAVAARYSIAVTPAMAALIDPADPADPIARQYIPDAAELVTAPHELADPTADGPFTPVKGVVHRYPDRALLKPLLACPVYCRFCFRREAVGPDGGLLSEAELEAALAWFAATPAGAGGDPDRRRSADALAAPAGGDPRPAGGAAAYRGRCASIAACPSPRPGW